MGDLLRFLERGDRVYERVSWVSVVFRMLVFRLTLIFFVVFLDGTCYIPLQRFRFI